MQALLSLGASPDYKDRRGLTPLYHTVLTGGETSCCETLLYHHAKPGIRDENGWDETHQVRDERGGRYFISKKTRLCNLQESVSASEPTHATTCCTSHVLSWTHFTLHPTHRASLASHSCCDVEREEQKVSARLDSHFLLFIQL